MSNINYKYNILLIECQEYFNSGKNPKDYIVKLILI